MTEGWGGDLSPDRGSDDEPLGGAVASMPPPSMKKKRRNNPKQFFIVFSPEGEAPPKVMHGTHPAAMGTAALMAKRYPNSSFFVMGSMSARVTPREEPASGMEAATAGETVQLGSTEGESAIGAAETPNPLSSTNPNTERQSL